MHVCNITAAKMLHKPEKSGYAYFPDWFMLAVTFKYNIILKNCERGMYVKSNFI